MQKSFARFKKSSTFAHVKRQRQQIGLVAQLNRASDYGSEGYRFESCRDHRKGESHLSPFSFFAEYALPPLTWAHLQKLGSVEISCGRNNSTK